MLLRGEVNGIWCAAARIIVRLHKENTSAGATAIYTAVMQGKKHIGNNTITPEAQTDALADAILDLWQENIRLCSEERGLFSLKTLLDELDLRVGNQPHKIGRGPYGDNK